MIQGLQPYPEMHTTGHPWLPSLPAHWEVRRNGRLFSERRETGYPDLPILEVSLRSGVRIRDIEGGKRKQQIADRSVYQRAVRGDIAYNMMRMWQGAVGVAPTDGLVSPAYVVARAHEDVNAAYYAYLFRTDDYMKEIDSYSRGIVPDRNRLYWQAFKQMPSAYPPLDEQRLIVRFLDWHSAMTGKLIRAKRRLIALLNEQKQSIIHRAVTRGLDPAVKLKPSGVDWIGDLPTHWDLAKVREIARVVNGYPFDSALFSHGEGHPLVRIRDLDRTTTAIRYNGDIVPAAIVHPGETLIGMDGDFNVGTWGGTEPALLNQRMCCIRCHDQRLIGFVRSALARPLREINAVTYATTVKHISSGQIERIVLPLPPVEEAAAIYEWLVCELRDLNRAIDGAKREIALIQEFHSRLIADVVTGQLDVRAVAAPLPEIAVENATIDAFDADANLDDADESHEELAA